MKRADRKADGSIVFEQNTIDYDNWFKRNNAVYQSEILAIKKAIPAGRKGIEIGVGTGRFAQPLQIRFGVEPSKNMAELAEQRGIEVIRAFAEDLPVKDSVYDFVLMVTTVCFLSDVPKAFSEAYRILRSNGAIVLGIIDKNSELGKKYEKPGANFTKMRISAPPRKLPDY